MSFRWVYSEPKRQNAIQDLRQKLGVPPEIARLLAIRDIHTFDQARSFFRPEIEYLHDPFRMKDMEEASLRLSRAIRDHEKVLVYGDYDVDGTTATAALLLFLRRFGLEVDYYIPHRFKEGYGINPEGIHYAHHAGASLIISVDCGITAVEEAKLIRQLGMDLIICDHHTVGSLLPDAVAVLDPKRPDCAYPFDGLSGAGVAFKLIEATLHRLGLPAGNAYCYLDLIAISIASDIVPIIDENRIMMRAGLEMINRKPRPGIRALLEKGRVKPGTVTTTSIVFSLGPRINAAGRMGDANTAVELMLSESPLEADRNAEELEAINKKRRDTDSRTLKEAMEMLEKHPVREEDSAVVLHHDEWHLGVIGIVASRLVDRYFRPVIMLSTVDGKLKGSARSIRGFNIYRALEKCSDLLEQFGGHEYAAGLTMERENLDEFRHRVNEIACDSLTESKFQPELLIDAQLDLGEVDMRFWKLLSQFEPYGPGNKQPVFVSKGVEIAGDPTIVGKGHLRVRLRQNGSVFDAIGFNMHEYQPMIRESRGGIDVAFMIEENNWNNRRHLQLHLKDIRARN